MNFKKRKFKDLDIVSQIQAFCLVLTVSVIFLQQYYIYKNSNLTIVMPNSDVFDFNNGVVSTDKYMKAFSDYIISKIFDQRGDMDRLQKNFNDIKPYLTAKVSKEIEKKYFGSAKILQNQAIDSFFELENALVYRDKGEVRTLGYRVDKFFNGDTQKTKILIVQKWHMQGAFPKMSKIVIEVKSENGQQ